MATYLPGVTDYIPQIQPFKPDLNFYSKVLQMKQDKYDAAKREISGLYGSLLYSPLTRQSNINRRDEFFKNIEHQIKKISAMDLSLAQNQEAAMKIFDPIINDNEMSHDWSYTKNIMTQMERGESFRMCADPKKCGGSYSPESMTYLNMKLQEYAESDSSKALSMSISDAKFVPYNNIVKDALDWAKSMDLLVEEAHMNGGYIVKQQNGQTIKVPLMQLFLSTFGKEPKYRMHYDQLAYINKRNWIQENLDKNDGDPIKTESAYYNDIINQTIKNLQNDITEYDKTHKQITTRSNAMNNRLSSDGIVANDDSSIAEIMSADNDAQISNDVDGYYQDLQNRISNLSINKEDMVALGKGIEGIVGDALMKMDLMEGVEAFANAFSSVTDIKENQFSLNAQRHQYAVEEMMMKFELDDQAAINAKIYEIGKETALKFNEGGLPDDQEGVPVEGVATDKGAVDMFEKTSQGYARGKTGVYKNQKYVNSVIINTLYSTANNTNLDNATRQLAKDELKKMLGGFYDENKNIFVNGKQTFTDYSQMVLDQRNESQIYSNAKKVLEKNKGTILRTVVNQTMKTIEQTEQLTMLRNGYGQVLTENNKAIRLAAKSRKEVSDGVLFDGLFVDSPDGSVNVITSEDQYVKNMMGTPFSKSMSPDTKEKFLRKKYKEYFELYKDMHNNPSEYGVKGIKPPTGFTLTEGPDGALYAEGRMWSSNYNNPNSYANRAYLDYMKDVARNKSYTKAIMGINHTSDELEDENENKTARLIFEQYQSGLLSGAYATDDSKKKAPRANVTYTDISASGDMVSVSLTNINPEWLKTLTTNKDNTMIGEKSIDNISEEGVTLYMSKEVANNLFSNNFKQKPGDVYINSGLTWTASRPDGGSVSIKKVNDMIMIGGELITIDGNGNRQKVSLANTFSADMISGAKLINTYTQLLDSQQTDNVNYLQNGGLPKVYDRESLMRAIQERMSPGGSQNLARINYFRQLIGR